MPDIDAEISAVVEGTNDGRLVSDGELLQLVGRHVMTTDEDDLEVVATTEFQDVLVFVPDVRVDLGDLAGDLEVLALEPLVGCELVLFACLDEFRREVDSGITKYVRLARALGVEVATLLEGIDAVRY